MKQVMVKKKIATLAFAILGSALSFGSNQAAAVTADNVICNKCVGTGDIGLGAVTTGRLKYNAVTSGKIQDNTIQDKDISTNAAIDVLKISGAAGVDYANFSSCSSIPTTMKNCGSVTLTAPKAGYAVVTLTGYAIIFGANTVLEYGIGTTSNSFTNYTRTGLLDGSDSIRRASPLSITAVIPVAAGSTRFYANAMKEGVFSSNSINIGNVSMSAVYVPNRY